MQNTILRAVNSAASDTNNIVYLLNGAMEKEFAPIVGEAISLSDVEHRLALLEAEFNKLLAEASEADDQLALNERFRKIMQEQTELKTKRDELQKALANSTSSQRMADFKCEVEAAPTAITEWDEALIRQVVDSVRVELDGSLSVTLKSGKCVSEMIKQL